MSEAAAPTPNSPYSDFQLPDAVDPQNSQQPAPYTRFVQVGLTEDGTIDCTLHVARVTEVGDFEALSYTWGPAQPTKNILLNGQTFAIRKNLWRALHKILRDREIREKEHEAASVSPYLWVDALSINQKDVLDRNHQVQHMCEIFSEAKLVLAWIGDGNGAEINTAIQEMRRHKPLRPGAKDLSNLTPQTIVALGALLMQPYWTRMWIVQEFVLAKDMRFLYGNERFTWREFKNTMLYLDESSVAIHCQTHKAAEVAVNHQYIRNSSAFSICRTRKMRQDGIQFDIFELITSFHKQRCSDPRDKVFALLGLATNTADIKADYTLGKEEVLIKVLKSLPHLKTKDGRSARGQFVTRLSELLEREYRSHIPAHVRRRHSPNSIKKMYFILEDI